MLLCAVKQKPSSWVFIQKSKLAVDIEKEPQVFPTLKKRACFCSASGEAFSPFSMVGSGFLGKMFLSVPTTWLRNRMEDRMKNGWKEAKCWMLTWKLKKIKTSVFKNQDLSLYVINSLFREAACKKCPKIYLHHNPVKRFMITNFKSWISSARSHIFCVPCYSRSMMCLKLSSARA